MQHRHVIYTARHYTAQARHLYSTGTSFIQHVIHTARHLYSRHVINTTDTSFIHHRHIIYTTRARHLCSTSFIQHVIHTPQARHL